MFYDKLSLVVKGDLTDPGRYKEIWNLNIGKYDHLLSKYKNEKVTVSLDSISDPKKPGLSWDSEGTYLFGEQGIHISLGRKYKAGQLELSLAFNPVYEITYYKIWLKLKSQKIHPSQGYFNTLSFIRVDVPLEITKRGFTDIQITPVQGYGKYSIGHLLLKEEK